MSKSPDVMAYNAMPPDAKATFNIVTLGMIAPIYALLSNFPLVVMLCYGFGYMEAKRMFGEK